MPRARRRPPLVGYYRISLADDEDARTRAADALRAEGVEDDALFGDVTEGDGAEQPELDACLAMIARGDTLVLASLDRLAPRIDRMRKALATLAAKGVTIRLLDGPCAGSVAPEEHGTVFETWLAPAEDLERRLRGDRRREAARRERLREMRPRQKRDEQERAAVERIIGQHRRRPTPQEKRLAELGYRDFFAMTPAQLDLAGRLIREAGQSRLQVSKELSIPYDAMRNYLEKDGTERPIAARMRRDAEQGGPERRLRKAVLNGELPESVLPRRLKLRARPAGKTLDNDARRKKGS